MAPTVPARRAKVCREKKAAYKGVRDKVKHGIKEEAEVGLLKEEALRQVANSKK